MASAHTGCVHAPRPKFPPIPSLRNRIVFGLACETKLAGERKKKSWSAKTKKKMSTCKYEYLLTV